MIEKIKKITVLTIIFVIASCLLFSSISNTYAAKEIEYSYIEYCLSQLRNEIIKKGSIDSDGNYFIQYEIDEEVYSMTYNYNKDIIECAAILKNDESSFHGVYMKLDGMYNDSIYPEVLVTIGEEDSFIAEAELLISEYTYDTVLHFNILQATDEFFYGDSTQNLCNSHLQLAISGWQLLLDHRTEVSLENIGFTSLCHSHYYYNEGKTNATLSQNGSIKEMCVKCGIIKRTTIYYPKTITLSKTEFKYNKKVQKPTVTVKDSNGKVLKNGTDYTVSYLNNSSKKVGQYTVTITFKGNYTGTKKLTYKINPKGVSLKKLTKGSKQFKATWGKNTTETTGYQIEYSTNKNFKSGNKKVTIKKNKTTSTTVKKLKKNKKYYVRIRTYKTVSGKKYYSEWSKVLNVKTK